jgi:hypothetical protein
MRGKNGSKNGVIWYLIVALVIVLISVSVFALSAPSGPSFTITDNTYNDVKVNFTWSNGTGSETYTIVLCEDGGDFVGPVNCQVVASGLTSNYYEHATGLTNGQDYLFNISSINGSDPDSPQSSSNQELPVPPGFYDAIDGPAANVHGSKKINVSGSIPGLGSSVQGDTDGQFLFSDVDQIEITRKPDDEVVTKTIEEFMQDGDSNNGYYEDENFVNSDAGTSFYYLINISYNNGESYVSTTNSEVLNIAPRIINSTLTQDRTNDVVFFEANINDSSETINLPLSLDYDDGAATSTIGANCNKQGNIHRCTANIQENTFGGIQFQKNKKINVTFTAEDTESLTPFYSSTSSDTIYLENAIPTTSNRRVRFVRLDDGDGYYNCTYDFADEDGDSENANLRNVSWYKKGPTDPVYSYILSSADTNLSIDYVNLGDDSIICELKVHDNEDYSIAYNTTDEDDADDDFFPDFSYATAFGNADNQIRIEWGLSSQIIESSPKLT